MKHTRLVLPRALGLKVHDPTTGRDYIKHLAFADDLLPLERPLVAGTVMDDQPQVSFELYEQTGVLASEELQHNKLLMSAVIDLIPRQPRGVSVDITLVGDEDGMLAIYARERRSGKDLTVTMTVNLPPDERQIDP